MFLGKRKKKIKMKKFVLLTIILFPFLINAQQSTEFTHVDIKTIATPDANIRALGFDANKNLWVATENGEIGVYSHENGMQFNRILKDSTQLNFRSIAFTDTSVFVLSIANPALLYKIESGLIGKLIYKEEHEKVFYDSMAFWNESEGIAMGDPTENCLSVIITRDGGESWTKLSCDLLPKTLEGEAAFAASNSNIAIVGDKTWLVSGGKKSRIFYSPDKGKTWQVFDTPIIQGEGNQGIYSVDFYDENNGIVFGGDYSKPDESKANKAITTDGGKTWQLVANGEAPGYRSCVQYVPEGNAKKIVAVGFKGIAYSNDSGHTWKQLSDKGFYTIKFLNDSTAYAAGKNKIVKLTFK